MAATVLGEPLYYPSVKPCCHLRAFGSFEACPFEFVSGEGGTVTDPMFICKSVFDKLDVEMGVTLINSVEEADMYEEAQNNDFLSPEWKPSRCR